MTGFWRPRERLSGRPLTVEISHASVRCKGGRPCERRQRPKQPLRGDHQQDHRRAGGRAPPLGAAVGLGGRTRTARHPQECRDGAQLLRHQRADPLGRRRPARLRGPELADVPAGRGTRRQRTQGRARARPSSMPTASCRTTNAGGRTTRARRPAPSRSSSASPSSTSSSARACPTDIAASAPPVATHLILPQVEELIRATGADVRIGGDKAYYDVAGDFIRVPPPQAFFEPINWHRTALHETRASCRHAAGSRSVGGVRLEKVRVRRDCL